LTLFTTTQPTVRCPQAENEDFRRLSPYIFLLFWLITLNGCKERQVTRPTPQMDAKPQFWVRVLLLDDARAFTLKTASAFSIIDPKTQTAQACAASVDAPINVEASGGTISIAGQAITNNEVIILPESPHIFSVNGEDYRGKLKLILNPDANSLDAINLVPLEAYLAGVTGAEMPSYWEPAALQAQTIAARTYCLHIKKQFGSNRNWDVTKTAANQVYLGVGAESAIVWDAIDKTRGQVLVCRQNDGIDVFPAYYSSSCGGHTENSTKVFGDSFEPLTGVPCPYCKDVAKPSFFSWPMVQLDKTVVTNNLLRRYSKLEQLGVITEIISAEQSNYGEFSRLTMVKLLGSSGKSELLRAEDFRLAIDPTGRKLKSAICQIAEMGDKWAFLSGRGCGHGVGMCQCGAEAMARQGKTVNQILFYYYPGSNIVYVY